MWIDKLIRNFVWKYTGKIAEIVVMQASTGYGVILKLCDIRQYIGGRLDKQNSGTE